MEHPQKKEIVLFIHGTNAADISNTGEQWWQRKSRCWQDFDQELHGYYDCQPDAHVFHWSGINSEGERRLAGRKLSGLLLKLEKEEQPYHLIGHSHGGSVIWHAIYSLTDRKIDLKYMKSWATVGTPFLFYETKKIDLLFIPPIALATAFMAFSLYRIPYVVEVMPNSIIDPINSVYPLLFLLAVSLIPLFIIVLGIVRLFLYFRIKTMLSREERARETAFRKYGAAYLGLWCNVDEALSGLSSTLSLGGEIVPRINTQAAPIKKIVLLIITPLRFFYNKIIAQASDEFIWNRLVKKLQGNDVGNFTLYKVSSSPILSGNVNSELSDDIKSSLIEEANKNAAHTIASVRNILGLGATSESNRSLVAGLAESIKYNELIHTSYFDNADIRKLLKEHILGKQKESTQEMAAVLTKAIEPKSPRSNERSYNNTFTSLSFLLNATASLLIILAWTSSSVLYDSYVYPFTKEYQVKFIASQNITARIVSGSDIADYAVTQLAQKLALLGYEDAILSQSREIKEIDYRLLMLTSIAHEFIENNRVGEAKSVMKEAEKLLVSNDDAHSNDGLNAVVEELAHLGKKSDALQIADTLSLYGSHGKDEALGRIAIGLAEAGLRKDAYAVLRSIPDIASRFSQLREFIDGIDDKREKIRAVDSLMAIVALVPEKGNWKSAALSAGVYELVKQGKTSKAYSLAQSIVDPGFRSAAYRYIVEKLLDEKKINKAKALLDEIPKQDPNSNSVLTLIKINSVAPDANLREQIVSDLKILESRVANTPSSFPENTFFEIASLWAELGQVDEALSILKEVELGSYKDSDYEAFKEPIKILVAQKRKQRILKFMSGINNLTTKCYFSIALASYAKGAEKQKELLAVEKFAVNVLNDEDQSFLYSVIAKEWVRLNNFHHAMELSNKCRSYDKVFIYLEVLDKILQDKKIKSLSKSGQY